MSATEENQKCSQKTVLSFFFLFELVAYVLSCVALISPSWQYAYLENGRTEHHHGLWLDCKRDYSHDYGRNREYYETLYRLDKQQSPFDQFFLTSLLCVYKFDYYIDAKDLYDHSDDENRLQDDANQHLLLGWKIATLSALGFAALTASAALLLSVCAFCHRTLICGATVLVTAAALLSSAGLLIFFIWANYQDNNIIKEEDGIYEQYFGWAVYMQIAGTTLQFLASFVGCAVTSMAFRRRCAKLVKIEVVDRDNSTLLGPTVSPPSKHSFSAVYKLDSADLQKWEDCTNIIQSDGITKRHAISVPNFKKHSRNSKHVPQESKIMRSTSNSFTSMDQPNSKAASETFSVTAKMLQPHASPLPKSILKASSKQLSATSNVNRQSTDDDLTYEYLPVDSIRNSRSVQTLSKLCPTDIADATLSDHTIGIPSQRVHSGSSLNVYDKVYEHISSTPKSHRYGDGNSKNIETSNDGILNCSERKQVLDEDVGRSTLINDVPSCSSALTTKLSSTNMVAGTIAIPMNRTASPHVQQNLQVSSNALAPSREIGEILVEPGPASFNLREFFVEQNANFHFSNEHSLNRLSDDTNINTSDLGTFSGREGKRCSGNGIGRFVESPDKFDSETAPKKRGLQNEAQLCLNLFMNSGVTPLLPGSGSIGSSDAKKCSITTV